MNRKPIELKVSRRGGFTLIELLVVMIIISILLGFIFVASMDASRRAEERATQSLITKLEAGLNDRLEALLQNVPDPNFAHGYLAAVYYGNSNMYGPQCLPSALVLDPNTGLPQTNSQTSSYVPNSALKQTLRAKAIATIDFVKSEMPDVFFIQSDSNYPLNFGGNPYPAPAGGAAGDQTYSSVILPLGNSIYNNPLGGAYGDAPTSTLAPLFGAFGNPGGTGIFGASYTAAAGIYKNLGYAPAGYDGIDNNGNGLVDENSEGGGTTGNLNNHTHNTARSEMLYAILVEGRGPLGSVFSRDDFTDREVQDTDQDGLPEFVDAWGQPLQFFRWPLLYHSDIQRGQVVSSTGAPVDPSSTPPQPGTLLLPYKTIFEEREQDPLDLNQQLMSPSWWSNSSNLTKFSPFANLSGNALSAGASGGVEAFEYFFHRLTEPISNGGASTTFSPQPWDRGIYYQRRAFYSKFLILSGGPDQQPGVFLYFRADLDALKNPALALIANENNAMTLSPFDSNSQAVDFTTTETISPFTIVPQSSYSATHPSNYDLMQWAQDDISNQNIQSTLGIGGSGS